MLEFLKGRAQGALAILDKHLSRSRLDRMKALPGWAHPYDLMPGHPLPQSAA